MKHSVYGKKLGRDKNQRAALFRSLVRELILNESIKTTLLKAKAVKGLVDRLISKSIDGSTASKRVVTSFINQPEVAKKLFDDIAPRYKGDRVSGFTSTIKTGRRLGDGAMMVRMSLMEGKMTTANRLQPTAKLARPKKADTSRQNAVDK